MLLAIDCGNTNLVFAFYKNANKSEPTIYRCRTDGKKTADEYAAWLMPLLHNDNMSFKDIQNVIIASVVPDINFNLRSLCEKYMNITPTMIANDGSNSGLEIDLPMPVKIGPDQIVNAVAAKAKYNAPVIVIDFGTATTFDIVNEIGQFIGGIIAPGVNLSIEALSNAAALLPKVVIERPYKIIGTNTIEAMQTGLYWGYVSMIEGLIKRVKSEMKGEPTIIATGGLSNLFTDAIEAIDYAEPHLTLEGLRLIHEYHQKTAQIKSAA